MTKNNIKKALSLTLCIVLIAAIALLTTGFSGKMPAETPATTAPTSPTTPTTHTFTETTETTDATEATLPVPEVPADVTVKGEGKTWFYFNVTDLDGTVTKFLIKTDNETIYDALLDLELITGEPFYNQLDVTSVNGITADRSIECAYWHFYINGRYAVIHIGEYATKITAGATYDFVKRISYIDKGKGATQFYLDALQPDNTIAKYRIHTDKEALGEALKELNLLQALPVDDGWSITSIDAIGGCYWDLYVNDEYVSTGVDMYATKITPDTTYRFARKYYLDVGEGANSFCLDVGYGELFGMPEGTNAKRRIHTNKQTVGEALQELGMITFDAEGRISSVHGYTTNWEAFNTYWELYIDGELSQTYVNDIPIVEGAVYRFKRMYYQTVLGSGSTSFYVSVNYPGNKSRLFQINTDKETLWEALIEVGLITIDSGNNGPYVSSVNGLSPDEGVHWEFQLVCTGKNVLFTAAPEDGNQYVFYQARN